MRHSDGVGWEAWNLGGFWGTLSHGGGSGTEFTRLPESYWASSPKEEDLDRPDRCSGSHPLVAMVKPAEDRNGDDLALVRALDSSGDRGIAIERSVGAGGIVVLDILGQDSLEMPLTQDDHVVETVST